MKEEWTKLIPQRATTKPPEKKPASDEGAPELTESETNVQKLYADNGKNWFTLKEKFQAGTISKAGVRGGRNALGYCGRELPDTWPPNSGRRSAPSSAR